MIPTNYSDHDSTTRPADLPRRPEIIDDTTPDDLASWWLDLGCGD